MDYGYTLMLKKNVNIYKLPNITSAKGHYLESWRDKIWVGKPFFGPINYLKNNLSNRPPQGYCE
jgi:hypothetical protein